MINYFLTLCLCYAPFFFVGLVILLLSLLLIKSHKKREDINEVYIKRVLSDIERLKNKGEIDKQTFRKIKSFLLKGKDTESSDKNIQVQHTVLSHEEKERKIKKRSVVTSKKSRQFISKYSASLLLYLGSFLIISAALILVAFNWEQFNAWVKSIVLPVFALAFSFFGFVFFRIKKVRPAGVTFLVISNILFPLCFLSVWRFLLSDIYLLNFWIYWTFVSGIVMILSFIYQTFLNNLFSKSLLVLSLFSLFASMIFAFDIGKLATVFSISILNLLAVVVYSKIRYRYMRKLSFLVSQVINILIYLYVCILVLFDSFLNTDLIISSNDYITNLLCLSSLFIPLIYLSFSRVKTLKSVFFLPVFPLAIVNIFLYSVFAGLAVERMICILTGLIFVSYVCERLFLGTKYKLERGLSFVFSVSLPFLLVSILGGEDLVNRISLNWLLLLGMLWVGYYLFRYIRDKNFLYLGLGGIFSLYPLLKLVFSFNYEIEYLSGIIIFTLSIVVLILSVILRLYKAKRSSYSLLPVFYFLNILGLLCVSAKGASSLILGLFILANVFINLLYSLYIYNGKYTQISAIYLLFGIVFVFSDYLSAIEVAAVYLLAGISTYILSALISKTREIWKNLPEPELVGVISNIRSSACLVTVFSFLISLTVALVLNKLLSVLIILFVLLSLLYFVYRYKEKKWFYLIFVMVLVFIIKFNIYFAVPQEFQAFILLVAAAISYLLASLHEKVLTTFKFAFASYMNLGLAFSLIVFFITLFSLFGTEIYPIGVRMAFLLVITAIVCLHGVRTRNVGLNVLPIYLLNMLLWRAFVDFDISNPQYFFITLGICFHTTNLVLGFLKRGISKIYLFDMLGIVLILGISLMQSLSDGPYLIVLVIEGVIYSLIWTSLQKKALSLLSVSIVVIGVVIQIFNLVISFPQWLILGLTGIVILIVGVIFLILRRDK